MRYLSKRDEFLKNYNKIVNIKEKYIPTGEEQSINEDAGPFVNNVGWGDSLLGRLINSTLRKIRIGANLVRIKAVEQRLRDAMDDLLLGSSVAELDEDDKKLYAKALIATYLIALEEGVKNGEPMIELKNLTETAISAVNQSEDLEDKNELLRQLNEWLKFLNQFKEEEMAQDEDFSEEEEYIDPTEAYLGNFDPLFNMLLIYQGIETEKIEYNRLKNTKGAPQAATASAGATPSVAGATPSVAKDPSDAAHAVGGAVKQNASVSLMKYDEFKSINEGGITKAVGNIAGRIF